MQCLSLRVQRFALQHTEVTIPWTRLASTKSSADAADLLSPLLPSPFASKYTAAVASGTLREDAAQRSAAAVLSRVSAEMTTYLAAPKVDASEGTFLSHFLQRFRPPPSAPPRGAYIWSNMPGCGKTMLADMMYDAIESDGRKRRDHFHSFTLEVHARLHDLRHKTDSAADKVGAVARALASEFQLLMVDEFQVTDISDAVIVHQLFKRLFSHGVALVATSNRPPEDLYAHGLQRELFTPLIPLLRQYCEVHEMGASLDYRLRHSDAVSSTYFLDSDGGAMKARLMFEDLVAGFPVEQDRISVLGRTLLLPTAVPRKRVALCKFEDLCERPLSSADYLALVSEYHTIVLTNVPMLDVIMDRNAVRRFTTFVDYAYEARVKLIVHAKAPPNLLLQGINGGGRPAATEEQFAAGRLVSRLIEMQTSDLYLAAAWTPPSSAALEHA
jgi:cell division protein ZapE